MKNRLPRSSAVSERSSDLYQIKSHIPEDGKLPLWKMFARPGLREPRWVDKHRSSKTAGNCIRHCSVSIRIRWNIWNLTPLLVRISLVTGYITEGTADSGWCDSGVKKSGWLLLETDKACPLQSTIWFARADKFNPIAKVQKTREIGTPSCVVNLYWHGVTRPCETNCCYIYLKFSHNNYGNWCGLPSTLLKRKVSQLPLRFWDVTQSGLVVDYRRFAKGYA